MDRFIVINSTNIIVSNATLKSNMDRFIEAQTVASSFSCHFKIQYG